MRHQIPSLKYLDEIWPTLIMTYYFYCQMRLDKLYLVSMTTAHQVSDLHIDYLANNFI